MIEQITVKYWCEKLQVGINNMHDVWMLKNNEPIKLIEEVYRGSLVFRIPCTTKRISYKRIKENITHKNKIIQQYLPF